MLPAPAMEGGMRILEESFFWRESHFFWFKSEQGTKAAKEGKEDKKRERKRKNRLDVFEALLLPQNMSKRKIPKAIFSP